MAKHGYANINNDTKENDSEDAKQTVSDKF